MSPEIRIGDTEREAAVAALGEHYAAGRLTKDEYDERAERAWTARTGSQLAPLFADLPAPHAGTGRTSAPGTARPGSARTGAGLPATRDGRRRFHPPLVPMLAIFVGIALLIGNFWVFWVLLGVYWWSGQAVRAARRRERYEQWSGWAGHGRRPHRGC